MDQSRVPLGGNIRKITFGSPTDGLTYQVGKAGAGGTISRIIRNENAKFLFGHVQYLVYVKNENGREWIWKYCDGSYPVLVENDSTPIQDK